MQFLEFCETIGTDADTLRLLRMAFCTRGKRKGRVLASLPSAKGPEACGAWRAVMSYLSPPRAGTFGLIWADDRERSAYHLVDRFFGESQTVRTALQALGQGFCEFNLWGRVHDVDAVKRMLAQVAPNALAHKQAAATEDK